jgi:hypothetical protein
MKRPNARQADRHNERGVAVGNIGRRRKGRGSRDQVEGFGIENGRSRTLDDPAAHNATMVINCKGEIDHTSKAARLCRIPLRLCEARHQRLLPTAVAKDTDAGGEGAVATGGASCGCG